MKLNSQLDVIIADQRAGIIPSEVNIIVRSVLAALPEVDDHIEQLISSTAMQGCRARSRFDKDNLLV